LHHFWRWLGFSLCHQSSSPGVINQRPEDWMRTGRSWSGPKIITTCHPLRLPNEPRRHTVDGTTSTRLRTQVSGETSSECVFTASLTGLRLATVLKSIGPDHRCTRSRRSAACARGCDGSVGAGSPGSPGLVMKQTHSGSACRLVARAKRLRPLCDTGYGGQPDSRLARRPYAASGTRYELACPTFPRHP